MPALVITTNGKSCVSKPVYIQGDCQDLLCLRLADWLEENPVTDADLRSPDLGGSRNLGACMQCPATKQPYLTLSRSYQKQQPVPLASLNLYVFKFCKASCFMPMGSSTRQIS